MRVGLLIALGVVSGSAWLGGCGGDAIDASRPRPLTASKQPADDPLAELAFMAGQWVMVDKGSRSEETWSPSSGSRIMTGAFRQVNPDGSCAMSEQITIIDENPGVFMRLRHFDDKGMPWKSEEAGPIVLRLESTTAMVGRMKIKPAVRDAGEAVFRKVSGSKSLDVITYRRKGDTLWSEVAFTRESGREPLRFEMKRVK